MTDTTQDNRPDGDLPGPRPDELDVPAPATRARALEAPPPPSRRRVDTSSEWFWPVVNLLGLVAVVAINALANTIPFNGQTTGEVLTKDPIHFQPAGWTFSIWSLIYLLLAVFVAYAFLPVGRLDPRMQRIAPLFLVSNIANIGWLVAWHWEQWNLTLVAFAVLIAALALIYLGLRRGRRRVQPPTAERLMVWTPFSVYFGWATVAFLANVAVWLDRTDRELWGMDGRWTAVTLLAVAVLVATLLATWWRDPAYAVAVAWALMGIVAEQWDRSMLVAFAAVVALVLVAALTIFGSLLAFELRVTGHVLPAPARRWYQRGDPSEARENGVRR
jgi:hypothetical protein